MKIHELNITSVKNKKRVGRGIASGTGKTAGRGTKGQNSRSGGGTRPGFEGGQNPLAKRLPKKRGFASLNPTNYDGITLERLNSLKAGSTVTNQSLVDAGYIKNVNKAVKILGTGTLTTKLTINLQAATKGAQAAIEKAGGTFTPTDMARNPKKPSTRNRKA